MSDTPRLSDDGDMRDLADDMERTVREDILPLSALMEDSFANAARSISDEMEKAARSGSLSMKGMVQEILADLSRLAADSLVRAPLEGLLAQIFSGIGFGGRPGGDGNFGGADFGGSRAGGGFTAPGNAYLVGERGPELFTPSVAGRIGPAAGGNVTINLQMGATADAESFRRSEPQVAAAMARALARANRNA